MKTSIYYQSVFARSGSLKQINGLLMLVFNYPKLVLDAFLRKGMGERYFPYIAPVVMFFILFALPSLTGKIYGSNLGFTTGYALFLLAYAAMTIWRWVEIYRAPTVYDFERFSLDTGKPWPFFYRIALPGKTASIRTIELYYEPLFCFLLGLLFTFMDQKLLGLVVMFCSIAYFFSTHISAKMSNDFILDKIDEIICNQDLTQTFVQGKDVSPRGVPFHTRKPSTEELRQDFVDHLLDDEDIVEAR